MKYLTLLLLTISLTAKAQDSAFRMEPAPWTLSTVGDWSPDSRKLIIREAYINIRSDGEYKRPVHFILVNDTLRVTLDDMFIDLIKRAKVIEVGGLRFWLETEPKPPSLIGIEQNWYTQKLRIIKRKPNKSK